MGSLGNQTFQGMPNLHPEVRRRLDDLVRAINGNASQLTALSQNALTAAQAKDLIKQALASRSLLPLNITNATGTAGTPQPALIPIVKALPKSNSGLTFGQAVQYQNDIWIWNGSAWVLAVTSLYSDTHANRIATFPAANYVTGTLFYETDRKVLYVNISGIWDFCSGTMIDTAANRPADLGATDRNFLFLASDSLVNSYWNGAAWTTISAPPPTTLTLALRSVGTTPDSITAADFAIFNYVLGAAVENLPQASTVPEKIFAIAANSGGATVTVTAYAGDTINGGGSTLVLQPGGIVWLQSDGGTNWVIIGRYGGTSAFPFAVIQESQITRNGAVTSWTYMFPQALQASGATGFMLLALNGATTPTYPAGWTVVFDIVNSQAPTGGGNDVRIVLLVKASAGDTTAVFGFSAGTSAAMYFFELNGARSVGTFSSAGGSWTTYGSSEGSAFGLPPITPSAGSLVFGMAAFCGDELAQQAPCISPAWRAIGALAASGGGYGLIGFVAQVGAAAAAITPPTAYTPFPIEENAGAAWVSFAIN